MKRDANWLKGQVDYYWGVYTDNRYYSIMYSAYNHLIKYLDRAASEKLEWAKEFIIDFTKKVKDRITRVLRKTGDLFKNIHQRANWFYLMYYYDFKGNFMCSKVGTTTQTLNARRNQHRNKCDGSYSNLWDVDIICAWDCGDDDYSRHLEIDVIKYFKKHYGHYIPNDRFNIRINPNEIDTLVKKLLSYYASAPI